MLIQVQWIHMNWKCFVTNDGAETDLDLGHYERFLDNETSH